MLPLEQDAAGIPELAGAEIDATETLDAKVEIFFFVIPLPQNGQITPLKSVLFRTRSSKDFSHSAHSNSNNGISISWFINIHCVVQLDASKTQKVTYKCPATKYMFFKENR
ncbi:MAG: hypothetical protein A2X25_10595 [Chloroflexi bacterium GWB2_49_20]|nr:MAG: hypothetical protein A2X25_10595 [Chloroflexi bacterium GWB2_49_20]OGN78990.1 MAG: hypothetical protein A2X26_00760 [Chloroflexi bacterium GWC2_49_37]OGN86249.1 MAG: hypothetical protein A2X27_05020 [Chloroflexi bacterium GWD2_49_16]